MTSNSKQSKQKTQRKIKQVKNADLHLVLNKIMTVYKKYMNYTFGALLKPFN